MTGFLSSYTPEPVAFQVFGIDIMWYGVLIAAGIALGTLVACRRAPRHGIQSERVLDLLHFCLPAGIIGARLYYVAFNWSIYAGDFAKIFNTRLGGLAIHGGLIAGFLIALIVCKAKDIKFFSAADVFVPGIALAQSIGRWGNYFNSEAHGGLTDLPWGIPVGGQMVHPTFLYESLWCLVLFFILILIDNRRRFEGQTALSYGMLYSLERFFVESLRTDSLMLFGMFKQARVISALIFILCLFAWTRLRRTARSRGLDFYIWQGDMRR